MRGVGTRLGARGFPTVYLMFPLRYRGPGPVVGRRRRYPGRVAGRRADLGSWLSGTGGPADDGERGPLPAEGRGSRAGIGRRLVGVAVDWLASLAVSSALFPDPGAVTGGILRGHPLATTGVFAVSTVVLVSLLGTTIGHRLLGIRVVRLADVTADRPGAFPPPGLLPALVRTVLLALVIPAVVWDSSGRGLHDAAAGTVIVRG